MNDVMTIQRLTDSRTACTVVVGTDGVRTLACGQPAAVRVDGAGQVVYLCQRCYARARREDSGLPAVETL